MLETIKTLIRRGRKIPIKIKTNRFFLYLFTVLLGFLLPNLLYSINDPVAFYRIGILVFLTTLFMSVAINRIDILKLQQKL